jgi:O-methyltransferase
MGTEASLSARLRFRLSRLLWPDPVPMPWSYSGDGFQTVHNADFLHDARFQSAYSRAKAAGAWSGADIEWRAYTVCWAAQVARALQGDFVECGVDRGGFAAAAMDYIGFDALPDRKFYLFDTYCGIPEETLADDPNRQFLGPLYGDTYDQVVRTFATLPNAVIVRGRVPDILPAASPEKVCYLCIDLNTAAPSAATAEFFWDRLVSGAPVVLDDYGQTFFHGMKDALDAFARRRGVEILALPTGQGLLFKP